MKEADHFIQANQHFGKLVQTITDQQWEVQTPDTEWKVRDLVAHVIYENLWMPDLFAGKTIAEVGSRYDGDVLKNDAKLAWQQAADLAETAIAYPNLEAKIIHLSYADVTGRDYAEQLFFDHLIHSWDLAAALGADRRLDPGLVEAAYASVRFRPKSLASSGLFAEPWPIAESSSEQDKLIALCGRDPRWSA